jgi:hypothetical protein
MSSTILLINGISLPYHVLDCSLEAAQKNGTTVKAVFIYENIDEKDYELPAAEEISKADLSESNAARNLEDIVQHNSSYVDTFFENNNVAHEIIVMKNPTIEEITAALRDADEIFIDHETFTHPNEFAYVNFTFEDLEDQISGRIEWCKRPE